MTFHSDALNHDDSNRRSNGVIRAIKSAAAFVATIAFIGIVQPASSVVLGAGIVTSLSLTFLALLQTPRDWDRSASKLDGVYAVLVGFLLMASISIAGGSFFMSAGLFLIMLLAEFLASMIIASGVSTLAGMYQAPIGIALNIHCRMFGLLGRAV